MGYLTKIYDEILSSAQKAMKHIAFSNNKSKEFEAKNNFNREVEKLKDEIDEFDESHKETVRVLESLWIDIHNNSVVSEIDLSYMNKEFGIEEAIQRGQKLIEKDGVHWFLNILNESQRDKLRDFYSLNGRTLKITDKMLNDIYQEELSKDKNEKLFPSIYY